jgi:hypothetical protein
VGDSQEFLQLRDYRPGDPVRRIHWPSTARSGRLVVKETGEEYFARIGLVMDTFTGDDDGAILDAAVSVAASLAAAPASASIAAIFEAIAQKRFNGNVLRLAWATSSLEIHMCNCWPRSGKPSARSLFAPIARAHAHATTADASAQQLRPPGASRKLSALIRTRACTCACMHTAALSRRCHRGWTTHSS